jgi:hypothetical protein
VPSHRVSLYSGDLKQRIAVFDGARFPVNAVAFHPWQPWLAIGTGIYDGGYFFQGELWAWNWETGERRRLLGESREVAACRFDDEGRLEVLVRPPNDDEFDFETYFRLVLDELAPATEHRGEGDPRLNGLPQVDPAALGFRVFDNKLPELSTEELATLNRAGYEQRHRVWDLAWLSDDRIAAVHDCCHLEIWSLASDRRELHLTGTGHGVELLRHGDELLVHVLERGKWEITGKVDRSTLFSLRGGALVPRHNFDYAHTFSIDIHGRVLARDADESYHLRRWRQDAVFNAAGGLFLQADLGPYNWRYFRLDGGQNLYFLRQTSDPCQTILCTVATDGTIQEHFAWEVGRASSSAGWGPGRSIVVAYEIGDGARVAAFALDSGQALWRRDVDAAVSATAVFENGCLAVAALDGSLLLLDTATGTLIHHERLTADGLPSFAMALAARDQRLAIGTVDGRLLIYQLALTDQTSV